jgi:hypothetical protein
MLALSKRCLLAAALALTAAAPAMAEELLGTRYVRDRSDTDVIDVTNANLYSAVKLCVAQRAVNFHDLDIHFANGGKQDAALRLVIGVGECSRWIDLNGGQRHITKIVMRYDAISGGVQAIVRAYGK